MGAPLRASVGAGMTQSVGAWARLRVSGLGVMTSSTGLSWGTAVGWGQVVALLPLSMCRLEGLLTGDGYIGAMRQRVLGCRG